MAAFTNREQFRHYFDLIKGLMGLAHWEIVVSDEEPSADAWMSVICWDLSYTATIRISDSILEEDAERQRFCAVHELVHCIQAQADAAVRSVMGNCGSLYEAWSNAREYGVDAVTKVIAPFMPLPDGQDAGLMFNSVWTGEVRQ